MDIEIYDQQHEIVLKEQRSADFCGALNIKDSEFQLFKASFVLTLRNGDIIKQAVDFYAGNRVIYTLFSNGKSEYRISVDRGASESEKWAASELQHWLEEISGAVLPVLEYGSFIQRTPDHNRL